MLPKTVLFLCLFYTIACNDTPGFFLKVSKNIPRIGRRSSDFDNFFLKSSKNVPRIGRRDQFVDESHSPEGITQQWYDQIMKSSKRAAGYNNVQPFDTKFLLDIFAREHIDPDDFKFVSWQDFDIALESDEQLFKKLIELAKSNHEVSLMSSHNVNIDKFAMGGNGGSSLFYRTERGDLDRSLNFLCHRIKGDDEFMELKYTQDGGDDNFDFIKNKIGGFKYNNTTEFIEDILLVKRNALSLSSDSSDRRKRIARQFVDYCKNEILLIDACGFCYALANTIGKPKWFSSVCDKRHPLVWAKVIGYPSEPAKQMRIRNQTVTVQFFGDHKIAHIPIKNTLAFTENSMNTNYHIGQTIMQEVRDYIKNLGSEKKECGERVTTTDLATDTLIVNETPTKSRPAAQPLPDTCFRKHVIELLDSNDERFEALKASFSLKERQYQKEITELQEQLRATKKRKWCDSCYSSTESQIKIFCSNTCGAKWYAHQSPKDTPVNPTEQ